MFSTPISAAAAFQYHWPFGDELCVAYAMIMSTAGCAFLFIFNFNPNVMRINNQIGFVSFSYWPLIFWGYLKKRNRIDHNIDGVGVVAMSTCRLLSGQTERSFRQSSQQRQWRQQRQTGPSPGRNFIDSHLDLFVGRHLSAAFRMGTLRS